MYCSDVVRGRHCPFIPNVVLIRASPKVNLDLVSTSDWNWFLKEITRVNKIILALLHLHSEQTYPDGEIYWKPTK